MTQLDIQRAVCRMARERSRKYIVPNVYLYHWESDVVTVTEGGTVDEYEVKVTAADFRADANKETKHNALSTGIERTWFTAFGIRQNSERQCRRPNRFWYVVPDGLAQAADVPEYAGLIYTRLDANRTGRYHLQRTPAKQAPTLHRVGITRRQIDRLLTSCYYRYLESWWK